MGLRVPDCVALIGCWECHNFLDNRDLDAEQLSIRSAMKANGEFDSQVLDGLCRTLALWSREGLI